MSPSLVFDQGQPSASIPPSSHAPSDPSSPLVSTKHQAQYAATAVCFQTTTHLPPTVTMIQLVLNLCAKHQHVTPPLTSVMKATRQVTCLFLVPMAPTSQPKLLLLLCWDLPCLPTGSSTGIPTPLLEKQLPYVYKCSCDTNKPLSPLSHSSLTINNDVPCQFNGAVFGQVFPPQTPKSSQVPIIVYHLPAPTISAQTPTTVVQDDTENPPPFFPNAPTLKVQLCPIALWVLCLDKTFTPPSLLPQHQRPEPVTHPPPPDAIAIIPCSRPIAPIQPIFLSVAASIPAPMIVFPDHFNSSLSSSIPVLSHSFLFSKNIFQASDFKTTFDQASPSQQPPGSIPFLHHTFAIFILISYLAESICL
jgi:hypothetical protein